MQDEQTPDPDNEGEGTQGDVSSDKEIDGLRSGMLAEREKRQAIEQDNAELRGRLSALEEGATRQAPAESTFTRTQLDTAVADGRVTQDEADRIYENQVDRRIDQRVTARVSETTAGNVVAAQIQQYKDAIPNLLVRGSDELAKAAGEFAWLRSMGSPDNLNTELAALRSVYGPAAKLKVDKGTRVLDSHQETGGSAEEGTETKESWPKGMPTDTKRFYEDQINRGILPDMAAAKEEWSYKPKHTPRHAK